MQAGDLVGNGKVLFLRRSEDNVGIFEPLHRLVCRNDNNIELVNLVELGRLCLRRTSHAGELLIQAEIILERDRRQRLVFAADVHAFLRFNGLMQPIRPASTWHQASGELVDDDDFAVFHYVLHVAPVESVRLDRDFNVVLQVPVFYVGDIPDSEQPFNLLPALIGYGDRLVLFVDNIIAGENFRFALFDLLALFQPGYDAVHSDVFVRSLVRRTGDDQRRTCLIDQDRVHLVDNRKIVAALHALGQLKFHVVAQVVEAELVVCAVSDVCCVRLAPLVVVKIVHNYADAQPEEFVNLAHPLGIALGQIIVHSHYVNPMPGQCIEIAGQRGDQRFAFAGLHFGDLALVQNHAADELHVEMPHVQHPPSAFTHDGERLRENFIEHLLLCSSALLSIADSFDDSGDPRLELLSLRPKRVVGELLHLRLERVDSLNARQQALHHALVIGPKYLS